MAVNRRGFGARQRLIIVLAWVFVTQVAFVSTPTVAQAASPNFLSVDTSPLVDDWAWSTAVALENPEISLPEPMQTADTAYVVVGDPDDPDSWFVWLSAPRGGQLAIGTYADAGPIAGQIDKPRVAVGQSAMSDQCGGSVRSFRIDELTRDAEDRITSLSAEVACADPAPLTAQLRFNSTRPVAPVASTDLASEFPRTLAGTASATQDIDVTNLGPGSLHPGEAHLTGSSSADFTIVDDGCNGTTVAAGSSCTITLQFRPADGPALERRELLEVPVDTAAGRRAVRLTGLVRRPTTIVVTSEANPHTLGDAVQFSATVTPAPDGGEIRWTVNGTELQNYSRSTYSSAAIGPYSVSARFVGTDRYAPSTGNTVDQVSYASSSIRWTVAPAFGQPPGVLDITAFLSTAGNAYPRQGTVTITDDTTGMVLKTATMSAELTYARLASINLPGLHILRATYSGVPPYRLPAESVILVEGTPPTDPPPVMQLLVGGLDTLRHGGSPGSVTIAVLDARGALADGYHGTVRVTSSDPLATLPADYSFTAQDAGRHTLPITLRTAGEQSVTVTDVETGAIAGTAHVVVGPPFAPSDVEPMAVSIGEDHTCGVGADGVVRCWGLNDDGQLGNDTYVDEVLPVAATGLHEAIGVAAGEAHTCGLDAGGQVWCWGRNASGQAPHPESSNGRTPAVLPGIDSAVAVTAGRTSSCALIDDGTVTCWGDVVGDGQADEAPTTVAGANGGTAIASGASHACVLVDDGTVRCWGHNAQGSLGDGTNQDSVQAVPVDGIGTAISVDADEGSSCAALANGSVRCWGLNDEGQLGDRTTTNRTTPVQVQGVTSAVGVAVGNRHACALLSNGRVTCWGRNTSGQLGDGTSVSRNAPALSDITGVTAITAGTARTCALASGGIRCWGSNTQGLLGDGSIHQFEPVAPTGLGTVDAITPGRCALMPDATVRCWGENQSGELGVGNTTASPFPVAVEGLADVTHLSSNTSSSCAVIADGSIQCWGDNFHGQLGDGTEIHRHEPVPVTGVSDAAKVSVGRRHSCAVRTTGSVVCWGWNSHGELGGQGAAGGKVQVAGLGGVADVVAGQGSTCALLTSGGVECWGDNSQGSLGNLDAFGSTPMLVSGISTATSLSGIWETYCVTLASGQVSCWGDNDWGQAGDGTRLDRLVPSLVPGISTAVAVSVGTVHACALLQDQSLRCWGTNQAGGLGDRTVVDRLLPVTVPGVSAIAVSAGNLATRVITPAGTIRSWGYGGDGGLGNGTAPFAPLPIGVAWPVDEPPRVTLELAPTTGTLNVPVILTTNVDESDIDGWLLSELPRHPAVTWLPTRPSTFTFQSGDAQRTLYAYVKDVRGNISDVSVATTTVDTTPPAVNGTLPAATRTRTVPIKLSEEADGSGTGAWLLSEVAVSPRANDPRWVTTRPTQVTLTAGEGAKRVYVWTRDAAHNVSVPSAPKTVLDGTPPSGGPAPVVSLRSASVTSSTAPIHITWGAAVDAQPGALRYELQSLASGSTTWKPITLGSPTTRNVDVLVAPGVWRFRVRALDVAGNAGPWRTTATWSTIGQISEVSSRVVYTGAWTRASLSGSVGGYVRHAKTKGRAAAITATARGLAFVSDRGPGRGKAEVWLDGVRVATVDLYAATNQRGRVVWTRTWSATESHRLRVVLTGTKRSTSTSPRVDLDAFLTLK